MRKRFILVSAWTSLDSSYDAKYQFRYLLNIDYIISIRDVGYEEYPQVKTEIAISGSRPTLYLDMDFDTFIQKITDV